MSFTGKATYGTGALPELAQDVSDMVAVLTPNETFLLDALGDPLKEAASTHHEWLEDELLPNKDAIDDATWTNPLSDTSFVVDHGSRFRTGDQIQVEGSEELMLVTAVDGNTLTVVRGYAGTAAESLANDQPVNILGNAALEGDDKPNARFTNRVRQSNYTQIFTAAVEVSGSDMAARQLGLDNEMDYQKQERLRGLLRDLENAVINGGQPAGNPQGSDSVRRSMRGIIQHLETNVFHTGDTGLPEGNELDEAKVNYVLRKIWENSSGRVDLIVVGGFQKRRLNAFCVDINVPLGDSLKTCYESDFGTCRIVTTLWMPQDAALFLDSSRIAVLPLAGRSFHYKALATQGDYECGELLGEYTVELRNESAHGLIRNLSTT